MKKADNFNPGQWLVENKLTTNSKLLKENKIEGIDLDIVKQVQDDPITQKLAQQFKNNSELAKKAAKFVADVVDGKINLNENTLTEKTDEFGNTIPEKTTTKGKIKQVLNSAGLGAIAGTILSGAVGGLAMGSSGGDVLQTVLGGIIGGIIAGLGIGAAATDGFQRKLEEGDENLADKIKQIIAMGREL
jgi:hypothetical protein